MKVLNVENLYSTPLDDLCAQAWYNALQNSIKDSNQRYPSADAKERDLMFERENCCQINYAYESRVPRSIVFEREQDYTMFILRWA
jgi:hypothetical protein